MDLTPPPADVDILSKTTVFQGYFRVDAYELRHRRFDGAWTGPMRREVFERGHAGAVLPYDPERNAFVLCQQFRVGAYAAGMEPWQLEVVAGIIEDGETPADVALREAREEAGLTLSELWPIQHYLVSPGGATESTSLFLGRASLDGAGGIFGLAEENEFIRTFVLREDELRALLDDGKIGNAATLVAVQWFFLNRERVRSQWCKS